jgi:hypothetical protein
MKCFPSPEVKGLFQANTVFAFGNTVPTTRNMNSTRIEDAIHRSLAEQQRQAIALQRTQAELCWANMGEELRYMSTSTVVRDIDFMARKIDGENSKMYDHKSTDKTAILDQSIRNFWGGSYGSILGAYLVNMSVSNSLLTAKETYTSICRLPHRVGYIAIDGIADAAAWARKS